MRRTGVLTVGACAVAMSISACSSSTDTASKLPLYTGGVSTSPATPSSSGPTATPAAPTTSASAGKTQSFTIRRGSLPAGLAGDTAAAAEAWLSYWEYLAVADSIPAMDPATVGSVMTGAAANKATTYVAKLQRTKTHVVGFVGVDMTSVSLHGSTATVCGRFHTNAFEFNSLGKPVESTLPIVQFYQGTAAKSGPKWRISDYVNLAKPC
jgi:hypothetical protein